MLIISTLIVKKKKKKYVTKWRKASHEINRLENRTTERIFCYDKRQSTSVVESKCFSYPWTITITISFHSSRSGRKEWRWILEAKNRGGRKHWHSIKRKQMYIISRTIQRDRGLDREARISRNTRGKKDGDLVRIVSIYIYMCYPFGSIRLDWFAWKSWF